MIEQIRQSWAFAWKHWRVFLPLTSSYLAAVVGPELIQRLFQVDQNQDFTVVGIGVIAACLVLILDLALVDYVFRLNRSQAITFGSIFRYAQYILPMLGTGTVIGLPIFLLALTLFRFASYLLPVLVVLVIWGMARTVYFRAIIVETNCGVWASLFASWRLTRGRFFRAFVVMVVHSALELVGFVALLIGLVISLPLGAHYLVERYDEERVTSPAREGGDKA